MILGLGGLYFLWRSRQTRGPALLLTLLIALLLSACAPKLTVRAEADPSVDFDQYRTWNFFPQLGIEGGNNSPVFGEHFRAAIERENLISAGRAALWTNMGGALLEDRKELDVGVAPLPAGSSGAAGSGTAGGYFISAHSGARQAWFHEGGPPVEQPQSVRQRPVPWAQLQAVPSPPGPGSSTSSMLTMPGSGVFTEDNPSLVRTFFRRS